MSATQTRSTSEIARKGREVFHRVVEPKLTPQDYGKFVAVAVDHDDFAMALKEIDAILQIMARYPGSLMHLERVGYPAACKIRRWRPA
jgi:hypothetical protein